MKTHISIVAVISGLLLSSASIYGQAGCNDASWNPESYSFYGEKAKIIEKFGKVSTTPLSERRVFLQVTQGKSEADIKLYERAKDGKFTVTEWATPNTSHLLAQIDRAIVDNKGVNCVGEQVKGILVKELKHGKVTEAIPAPESLKAAFGHSVEKATGEFIKSVIFLLC